MSASELPQSEDRGLHKQREESSTMLRLIKRLKNMEESFRSTRSTVQVRCQELEDRESQVADHRRNLDVLKAEADKRAVELEKLIQERRKEERHLDSLKVLIKEKKEELEIKERTIGLKEGECESIQERMKDGLAKVSRIEKEIEEKTVLNEKLSRTVEVKGKLLCLHRRSGEEWSRKLAAKGRQLEELSGKIELKRKQLEPRVEEIHLIENRVNECLNEIELRERSIHGREESMKEWSSKLEAKGKELEELSEKIELKEKQLEPRVEEIELKERHLQSLEKSIQGREKSLEERKKRLELISDGLAMREKELDRKAKGHQLKQYEPAPGNSNISSPIKSENRVANTEAISSSQSIQQHTATTIDARHMQGIQNEQFREAAYSALKGIIYDLIGKKRLTEAVGLIYTLKLFDKFPPAQILKEYVENGKKCCVVLIMKKKLLDEKDKITEEHVADLRVVIQCIKDYNLESEYPPEEVERQIVESERYKKLRRQKTSLKNVELEEQIEQKQDQPTSGAKLQEMAEHKTSKALKKVKQNASSKVEKQQQLQAQKAFTVEQQGQQQEQTNAKLQGKAVQKASASKVEQQQQLQKQEAQKISKAKQQEKLEHKASNKVEEQQQLQQRQEHKTSKDKQQQQNVEQNASYRVDEQQQQQEKNASKVNQQEQQVQKASEVKQQQTNGNKRSFTFAPRFDHQQKFINNKFQRTSIVADRPFRLHLDHPDYPNPSPSTWRHVSYGYQGQFGPAFNNYEVHANHGQFGIPGNGSAYYRYGGRDPRLNQSYPYPPRHPPH